eukprot:Hpha_TRINITY_DN15803_c5_g1::TRINITY_DN15803_c5_g1_i1::g.189890::m.189890/K04852/CACNA1E; voltage-dependent calcium channel R type alpha-1E
MSEPYHSEDGPSPTLLAPPGIRAPDPTPVANGGRTPNPWEAANQNGGMKRLSSQSRRLKEWCDEGNAAADDHMHDDYDYDEEEEDDGYGSSYGEDDEEERRPIGEYRRLVLGCAARAVAVTAFNRRFNDQLDNKSCFCVTKENPFRAWCIDVINHKAFQGIILGLIITNSITLALDSPDLAHVHELQILLMVCEYIFFVAFTLECMFKVFAMGFYGHKHAYLSSGWNILDFIIVVFSLADVILPMFVGSNGAANVSAIRLLRVLRPLRTVSRVKGMKVLVKTLLGSLGSILDVFLLLSFILVVFAVAGVQLWSEVIHQRCYLVGTKEHTLDPNDGNGCSHDPTGYKCGPGSQCETHLEVFRRRFVNFDHIASAMFTTFKAITLDDWPEDLWHTQNTHMHITWVYYFVLVLFGAYFSVNLFLAVLSKNFNENQPSAEDTRTREKQKLEGVVAVMQQGTARNFFSQKVHAPNAQTEEPEEEEAATSSDAPEYAPGDRVQVFTDAEDGDALWEHGTIEDVEGPGIYTIRFFADGELWHGVPAADIRRPPLEKSVSHRRRTSDSDSEGANLRQQLSTFRLGDSNRMTPGLLAKRLRGNSTRSRNSRKLSGTGSSEFAAKSLVLGKAWQPYSVVMRDNGIVFATGVTATSAAARRSSGPTHGMGNSRFGRSFSSQRLGKTPARLNTYDFAPSPRATAPGPTPMQRTNCVRQIRAKEFDIALGAEQLSSGGSSDGGSQGHAGPLSASDSGAMENVAWSASMSGPVQPGDPRIMAWSRSVATGPTAKALPPPPRWLGQETGDGDMDEDRPGIMLEDSLGPPRLKTDGTDGTETRSAAESSRKALFTPAQMPSCPPIVVTADGAGGSSRLHGEDNSGGPHKDLAVFALPSSTSGKHGSSKNGIPSMVISGPDDRPLNGRKRRRRPVPRPAQDNSPYGRDGSDESPDAGAQASSDKSEPQPDGKFAHLQDSMRRKARRQSEPDAEGWKRRSSVGGKLARKPSQISSDAEGAPIRRKKSRSESIVRAAARRKSRESSDWGEGFGDTEEDTEGDHEPRFSATFNNTFVATMRRDSLAINSTIRIRKEDEEEKKKEETKEEAEEDNKEKEEPFRDVDKMTVGGVPVQWLKNAGCDCFEDDDPVEEKEFEDGVSLKDQLLECKKQCLENDWGGFSVMDKKNVHFREQRAEEILEALDDAGEYVTFYVCVVWERHDDVGIVDEGSSEGSDPKNFESIKLCQDVCTQEGYGAFAVYPDNTVRYTVDDPGHVRGLITMKDPRCAQPGVKLYVPAAEDYGNIVQWFSRKLVRWKIFDHFMLFVTVLNVLVLGVDHYGIQPGLATVIEWINLICTIIFTLEIILKFAGLGFCLTFRDPYNRFDFFLVVVGIPQLLMSFLGGGGGGNLLSVFRMLRVLRVLRLARRWERLRKVILVVLDSMASVAYLSMLLMLLLFIYAVMGMQLFGYSTSPPPLTYHECDYPSITECSVAHPKRLQFNSLWRSLLTVFVIITGEGWAKIAITMMEDVGWASCFYYISLFVMGRYIILNLFVAIIIEQFQQERESENERAMKKKERKKRRKSRAARSGGASSRGGGSIFSFGSRRGSFWGRKSNHARRASSDDIDSDEEEGGATNDSGGSASKQSGSNPQPSTAPASPVTLDCIAIQPLAPIKQPPPEGVCEAASAGALLIVALVVGGKEEIMEDGMEAGDPDALGEEDDLAKTLEGFSFGAPSSPEVVSPTSLRPGLGPGTPLRGGLKKTAGFGAGAGKEVGTGEGSVRFGDTGLVTFDKLEVSQATEAQTTGLTVERRVSMHPDVIDPKSSKGRVGSLSPEPSHGREARAKSVFELKLMGSSLRQTQPHVRLTMRDQHYFKANFPVLRDVISGGVVKLCVVETFGEDCAAKRAVAGIDEGDWQLASIAGTQVRSLREVDEALDKVDDEFSVELLLWASLDDEALAELDGIELDEALDPLLFGEYTMGMGEGKCMPGFKHDGCVRRKLTTIIMAGWTDQVILALIVTNLLVLGTECPATRSSEGMRSFFYWSDFGFTAVFTLEMFAKMIVLGFAWTPAGYLTDLWNVIDFVVVTTSLLGLALPLLQLFRSFRVFRLITRSESAKVVLYAVVGAMPQVFNGLIVCAFAFILFAILGVQLLKGDMWECNDEAILHMVNCTGNFSDHHSGLMRVRKWQAREYNFDNLGNALFTLFKISLSEMWVNAMFAGMDVTNHETGPQRERRGYMCLFFVLFFIVANFLCLNLIISILIAAFQDYHEARFFQEHGDDESFSDELTTLDSESPTDLDFHAVRNDGGEEDDDDDDKPATREEKRKAAQARAAIGGWHQDMKRFDKMKGLKPFITGRQRDWVRAQQLLVADVTVYYRMPDDPVRKKIFWIVEQNADAFDTALAIVIILNLALLCAQHRNQSVTFTIVFEILNNVFVDIYIVEFILKVAAFSFSSYISDGWNRFDFTVLVLSVAGLGFGESLTFFRVLRVFRVLRLFRMLTGLNKMFTALLYALPPLMNIGILLACIFFIFGVIGVEVYAELSLELNPVFNRNLNFRNLGEAAHTLFQISTAEYWTEALRGSLVEEPFCEPGFCGTKFSYLYYVLFMVCVSFILVNLFVAVVLDAFTDADNVLSSRVSAGSATGSGGAELVKEFRDFRKMWLDQRYDSADPDLMPVDDFLELYKQLGIDKKALGPAFTTPAVILKDLRELNIPVDKQLCVDYNQVAHALARKAYKIPLEKAFKFRNLSTVKVTDDMFTVAHVFCVRKIAAQLRGLIAKRKAREEAERLREERIAAGEEVGPSPEEYEAKKADLSAFTTIMTFNPLPDDTPRRGQSSRRHDELESTGRSFRDDDRTPSIRGGGSLGVSRFGSGDQGGAEMDMLRVPSAIRSQRKSGSTRLTPRNHQRSGRSLRELTGERSNRSNRGPKFTALDLQVPAGGPEASDVFRRGSWTVTPVSPNKSGGGFEAIKSPSSEGGSKSPKSSGFDGGSDTGKKLGATNLSRSGNHLTTGKGSSSPSNLSRLWAPGSTFQTDGSGADDTFHEKI